jgi:uncharacterized membrane protein
MKKKLFALFALFVLCAAALSAQVPQGMESLADTILGSFTGTFMKVVLAIFLCGSAVAYAFNKDNEKIKRSALAVGIAAGIIISAQFIIDAVWTASGG